VQSLWLRSINAQLALNRMDPADAIAPCKALFRPLSSGRSPSSLRLLTLVYSVWNWPPEFDGYKAGRIGEARVNVGVGRRSKS
jgi:hypothetical protein